ncbi:ExbD/TolR family protein [Acidobacteriota bacterium]
MSHGPATGDEELNAEPNVVPLCDVLLVLLIIFMVVTPLVQKGVDVRLPTALNTIDMPENPDVVLSFKKDGAMLINQAEATIDNLMVMLEEEFLTSSDKRLYIKADQNMEYGKIVEIIEIIRDAGVEILGIITDKKTGAIE